MATNLSQLGLEVDKVEHSDIPTGGTDKVLLYASGSGSDTRLYVKAGSNTQKQLGFDIDQFDALGGTGVAQGDHFIFSDGGTEKKITFSNMEDAIFGNVSGDATIAAGGALTIAADAVESGMLNDNVISGQTELASDGLAAADELMISDGGTLKKIGVDNLFKDGPGLLGAEDVAVGSDHFVFLDGGASGDAKVESVADLMTAVAGDGLAASSGVLAVGVDDSSIELNSDALRVKASGVTNAMLAGSIADSKLNQLTSANKVSLSALDIDGATALGGASVAQADLLVIDDGAGGTNKSVTFSNFEDSIFGNISGDATVAAGGALTIANDAVEQAMIADDAVGADQLASNAVVNASVDAAAAISATKLDFNVDLGGNVTFGTQNNDTVTFTGHVNVGQQLTASHARITNLDVVTLNSIAQTETTLEISDKLIVASLSASSANSAGGGLRIGGGAHSNGHASLLWDHGNSALDFNIGGTTEMRLADGVLRPETDNDVDLGASGAEFKDLYLDGVAYIDDLRPDLLKMPDVTSGKLLVADGTSYEEVALSGDATLASNGALTIANDAVEQAMIADDAVGADQLAANAVVNASVVDGALKADKLDIDGSTDIGADLVDADLMIVDDGAAGANRKSTLTRFKKYIYSAMSGDATASDAGALTIANDAVEQAMIADDAVGADQLAANAVVNASVASNAAIEGTKLNLNVDFGGNYQIGSQSDDVCAFGGPIKGGGNAIADSGGNAAITFDGSQNISIAAAMTGPSGYASGDFAITANGSGSFAGDLIVGRDGQHAGGDATFFGDTSGEKAFYSGENNIFQVTGSAASGLRVSIGGDATSEFAVDVANGSNNNNKMRAAAFVTYSDESLKQDVSSMANTALDTVMSLEGVEFTWKDSGERDFGFIAQDVHSVLPKAVHTAENGVQGVDYSRLTSVLVEAVKAQQVQIEELKALLKK